VAVRDLWPLILKVAAGEKDREVLPRRRGEWAKVRALDIEIALATADEEEIPF
jgi:hypothetical protein